MPTGLLLSVLTVAARHSTQQQHATTHNNRNHITSTTTTTTPMNPAGEQPAVHHPARRAHHLPQLVDGFLGLPERALRQQACGRRRALSQRFRPHLEPFEPPDIVEAVREPPSFPSRCTCKGAPHLFMRCAMRQVSDELYEQYLRARDFVVGKDAVASALAKVRCAAAVDSCWQGCCRVGADVAVAVSWGVSWADFDFRCELGRAWWPWQQRGVVLVRKGLRRCLPMHHKPCSPLLRPRASIGCGIG